MTGISTNLLIILAGALATYATRIGGHLVLSRFRTVPPRLDAALNAVPAAVLTTLVAPELITHGLAEAIALATAFVVALRFPFLVVLVAGWISVVVLRGLIG